MIFFPLFRCKSHITFVKKVYGPFGPPADKSDLKTKSENLKVVHILKPSICVESFLNFNYLSFKIKGLHTLKASKCFKSENVISERRKTL